MIQMQVSPHCDCCGLPINPQAGEDCPRCKYPVNFAKEERFLASALQDLQRVATYGGVNMTVRDLIHRYQVRLDYLRQLRAGAALVQRQPQATPPPQARPVAVPSALPTSPVNKKVEQVAVQPPTLGSAGTPIPPSARMGPVVVPAATSAAPAPVVTVQERKPRRTFSFSWKSFLLDQVITIIGLLGAFLILIGALSSVITTGKNSLLSFLIVFGVHAFFGVAGVIAFRFANFRLIARIYTGIYTLLIPLVGFTAYNLVGGNYIQLSAPTLVVIAAIYATIVYILLAVYERFVIFGYLGAMALLVADLALAVDLNLGSWWWPSMLMLLALPALLVIISNSTSGRERFFTGSLTILRVPVRVFMYGIVGLCLLSSIGITVYSFNQDIAIASIRQVRLAILCVVLLLLVWTSLFFWLTKRTRDLLVLVVLFLACVLAACYAFDLTRSGYILALTGTALLYHGFNRLLGHRLAAPTKFSLRLDQIALLLISSVPFIAAWQQPLQLLCSAYHVSIAPECMPMLADWNTVAGLLAVGTGIGITISITLWRSTLARTISNKSHNWPWLLLLSGFLLTWEFGELVLVSRVEPVWCFAGLVVVFMITALIVRRLFGVTWVRPLEVVILAEILFTLVLSLAQPADRIAALLLFFALLIYVALLYQQRSHALFLPLILGVLALPLLLFTRPAAVLIIGLALPLFAVAVHWVMRLNIPVIRNTLGQPQRATVWERPPLALGLLYGGAVLLYDLLYSTSITQNWLRVTCPIAVEIGAFALVWYASAALSREKWQLLPVIGFASAALLLPANPFWVLVGVVPVAALLALSIGRLVGKTWAAPLYVVALLSAVMSGIAAETQGQLLASSWTLLAFGLLAYIFALAEDLPPLLWLLPAFNIWALVLAARVGDLYRPPTIALAYAAVGVAIGCLNIIRKQVPGEENWRNKFLAYSSPFYITACAAAILTGVYGTLPGAQPPFYGAIPDALLIYALVAFGVALFERQPRWLWLITAFATWATLLATRLSLTYVIGIGLAVGLLGLLFGEIIEQSMSATARNRTSIWWNWPWYLAALVGAVVVGVWPYMHPHDIGLTEYALFAFAALAYIIGAREDPLQALWLTPMLITWSLIDSAMQYDSSRLLIAALVCAALGIAASSLKFLPRFQANFRSSTTYAQPLYMSALVAAILVGVVGSLVETNSLFYVAVLLVCAAFAFGILLFERKPEWLILVASFGVWGTLLTARLSIAWPISIAIGTALLGIAIGRIGEIAVGKSAISLSGYSQSKLTWSWPLYLVSLVAMLMTIAVQNMFSTSNVPGFMLYSLLAFIALAIVVMLVERIPELLLVPVGLAAWTIWQWQPHPSLAILIAAYSILGVLIFAMQFVWKVLPPLTHWLPARFLHRFLALGGHVLLLLVIMFNGGLSANSGLLAFVGAGTLTVLALLVFWFGRVQSSNVVQRYSDYAAGLLAALSISWLLVAFHQVNIDLLLLAPATYLILMAPILMRDEGLSQHHLVGQAVAMLGAALLLLPTVWLSFGNGGDNLLYTLVLLGEALVLLLVGIGVGVRVFVLTAAGLIVVGAIHALFLQTQANFTGPLLIILGMAVVAIATVLTVFFQRVKMAWKEWD